MKKMLFLAATSVLLLPGTGAASAFPTIVDTPTGIWGYVSITNFRDTNNEFNISFANLQSPTGGAATVNLTDTSFIDNHVKLYVPPGDDSWIDWSPDGDDPTVPPGTDTVYLDINYETIFTGNGSADWSTSSLSLGPGGTAPSTGTLANFTYNGTLTLFNVLLSGLSLPISLPNYTIIGELRLDVNGSPTATDFTLLATEACTGGTCFTGPTGILALIDNLGSPTNRNNIDLTFRFPAGTEMLVPEPASLALLSIGLAGLGLSRRKKAA